MREDSAPPFAAPGAGAFPRITASRTSVLLTARPNAFLEQKYGYLFAVQAMHGSAWPSAISRVYVATTSSRPGPGVTATQAKAACRRVRTGSLGPQTGLGIGPVWLTARRSAFVVPRRSRPS